MTRGVKLLNLKVPKLYNKERLFFNMNTKKDLMSVKEVQEFLGIGKNTAYNLFKKNDFPMVKVGKSKKVFKEDLIEYLKLNK